MSTQKQWSVLVTDVCHAIVSREICDYKMAIIINLIMVPLTIEEEHGSPLHIWP